MRGRRSGVVEGTEEEGERNEKKGEGRGERLEKNEDTADLFEFSLLTFPPIIVRFVEVLSHT